MYSESRSCKAYYYKIYNNKIFIIVKLSIGFFLHSKYDIPNTCILIK